MAIPPRQLVPATGGVNAALFVSAGGRRAIQDREGYRDHFYDDVARNCSFGVEHWSTWGLAALPKQRPVPDATIQASLTAATNRYAAMVRNGVPDRALSQDQFDALTSFVYNVPALAPQLLRHVNTGEDTQALDVIRSAVNIHDHDAHGHVRGLARYSPGLAARRQHEVDQFNRR